MECRAVGEQIGQLLLELVYRPGFIKAEGFAGRRRAVTETIPDFTLHILFTAEQQGAGILAAEQHDHRVRFRKTGEIPEIAVGTIGVRRIAVAQDFCGRGNDGHAIADLLKQALTTRKEELVVHWFVTSCGEKRIIPESRRLYLGEPGFSTRLSSLIGFYLAFPVPACPVSV